jgi:hypothetical protein
MFTLMSNPLHGDFAVRPVRKTTDRPLIREIFRKEFYGASLQSFADDGLWEIYDSMETMEAEVFGAYLVSFLDRPLFLLEIHPPTQMDFLSDQLTEPGTIGIYCFYISPNDPMNQPGFRACIGSLLDHPGVDQILTSTNHMLQKDPRIDILEHAGFASVPEYLDRSLIYRCTQLSFPLLSETRYSHTY